MKHSNFSSGFTILEMLVVIAIVTILGGAVIFGYRAFSDRLAVSAASQDIAIAIRQAQTDGVSVKQSGQDTGNFSAGYGIYFTMADPTSYQIFSDENNDGVYDGGAQCGNGGDCLVEKDTLRSNASIVSICDVGSCSPEGLPASAVSIVFVRPNPDALIHFSNTSGTFADQSARIVLTSAGGTQSTVTVESTGQISTQ